MSFGIAYDSGRYPLRQHFLRIGPPAGGLGASVCRSGRAHEQAGRRRADSKQQSARAEYPERKQVNFFSRGSDFRVEETGDARASEAQEKNRIELRPRGEHTANIRFTYVGYI